MVLNVPFYRNLLESRRNELLSMLERAKETVKPVKLDQSSVGRLSRMDAMQAQAMAKALEQRRTDELSRIGAALIRLKEGEYGYCVNCEEPISCKRLEFNPSVLTCFKCTSTKK